MADLPEGMVAGPPTPDATLKTVAQRESGGRNLPPEANVNYHLTGPQHSSASGIYQVQPATWKAWAKETGIGQEYAEAYKAPPDVQTVVAEHAEKKYGPNSTYTWAASAPRGGYQEQGQQSAQRLPPGMEAGPAPQQKLPPGMEAGPAPTPPAGQPWRVPPANEGSRAGPKVSPNQPITGPPQRPPGAIDPSIAANTPHPEPGYFDPEKQVYAMLQSDPMGTLKKLGVATVEEAKGIISQLAPSHLAQLAHQVGAETAANTATPQTAGQVANLAQLGMRGAPGGRVGLAAAPKPAAMGESVGIAGPPPNEASVAAREPQPQATGARKITIYKNEGVGEGYAHYGIDKEDGTQATALIQFTKYDSSGKPTEASLESIGNTKYSGLTGENAEESRNTLGPAVISQLRKRFQEDYPTVTKITGNRLSGARFDGGYEPEYTKGKPVALSLNAPLDTIKSPAIKTADGRIVEGPNHDAIKSAGTDGEEGFTTAQGQFVNRSQGAALAKITRQAPSTIDELRSEDLRPQAVGAQATNKAVMDAYKAVPPTPTKDFINSTDDSFFRLRQAATADKSQMDRYVQALPPELKDSGVQGRMYDFMEGGAPLSEQERPLYDKYIKPLKDEEKDLHDELNKVSPEFAKPFDPNYVHRMVRGKTRELDPWMGEAGSDASPVSGYRSRSADSQKERVYYAIENDKGARKLVAVTDKGTMVLNKGQDPTPLPRYQGSATAPGDKFTVGNDKWTVKQARTSEIEQNTDIKYYKNALASTIKNVVQLRAAVRATAEINRLKTTPEFQAYTAPLDRRPPGWESVDFPPFRDRWFQPHLAHLLNDFWAAKKPALGEKMAGLNRLAVGSLFWSPIPHILNAGAHWVTERGWDWVVPHSYRSLLVDGAKAVRQVVTQGEDYQKALRDGSGMVYGSVANEQFYRTILSRLGEAVKQEPWKWDPIARVMGVGPSDLAKMLYGASSRALWSVSDMMMMQRLYELRRHGMSMREAIAEAEKHMPNYRIPPQVLGSRMFAAALKDPSLTVFSPYHYAQFKSYAHMAKDLASAYKDPQLANKAMGNVFATAMLIGIVGPLINRGIQALTGDKKVEMGPKGSTTIPVSLYDAWHGKPIEQVIQGAITLAPAPKAIYEGLTNTDWFTKKKVVEPFDMEKHRFGRVGAQLGEKAAQETVLPYGTAAQASGKGGMVGAAEGLVKQGLGLRKPFAPYHGREGGGTSAQQANYRHAHPRGPIEALEKRAEQWLKR